jgi:hypothetical protein
MNPTIQDVKAAYFNFFSLIFFFRSIGTEGKEVAEYNNQYFKFNVKGETNPQVHLIKVS